MEPTYNIKEVIELQFKGLRNDLQEIKATLREQTAQTERRFAQIEAELADIRKEQEKTKVEFARYQVIWGVGAAIGATLVTFTLNRIF